MRVLVSGPATEDLAAAFQYLSQQNPRAARSVRSAIRRTIRSLAQMPSRGRPSSTLDLREVVVRGTPYIVIYGVVARQVTVYRIRHTRQDPAP